MSGPRTFVLSSVLDTNEQVYVIAYVTLYKKSLKTPDADQQYVRKIINTRT